MSTLRVNTLTDVAGTGDADAAQIGVAQTWQLVTRTAGVTYTNTTGRPLLLNCNISGSSAAANVSIVIGGVGPIVFVNVGSGTGPCQAAGNIIIPVGATYVLTDFQVATRVTHELRT
jgi:hypothetical protein